MISAARQPCIHILLPVHNRRAVTEAFLQCLLRQSYGNWHLLLIDDGSTDGTAEMARGLVPALTLLPGKGDWWWGGSLHQGYRWIRDNKIPAGDLVVTMNDDTEFGPDFLANAVSAIQPGSLLLAQAYKSNGEFCEAGVWWDWENLHCAGVKGPDGINCFSTRGLFFHAGDFMKIGGFYPRLLPHYLSDYEFSIRAHRKGFALITSPEVSLRYFEELTGIRSTVGMAVWKTLKTNLSIKSTGNPVYWTSFVLLSCPRKFLPRNLFRIWWRYLGPVRDEVNLALAPVRRALAPIRAFLGRGKRKLKREWAGFTTRSKSG